MGIKGGIFCHGKFSIHSGAAFFCCIPAKEEVAFLFRFRQPDCLSFFYFYRGNLFPSVRIKRNSTCGCFFPHIMGFQGDIIGDGVSLPCLPGAGIIVIPANKLITIFGAAGKGDSISNLCSDSSTFHFSSVCVKSDGGMCLFPCGIVGRVLLRGVMLFPCISCKYCQSFVLIPALKAVALSGSVRECYICPRNNLLIFCFPCTAIINVGQGNRIFGFPLCIKIKIACQVDLLTGCIISPFSVCLCIPTVKVTSGFYQVSHKREKLCLPHDGHCISTGVIIWVRTHNAARAGRAVIGIISDRIGLLHFRKIEVFAPFLCAVASRMPYKLLRACVLMVELSVNQYSAGLYIVIAAKHKNRITFKILIKKDRSPFIIRIKDVTGSQPHCMVILHDNVPGKDDPCLIHVTDRARRADILF